MKHLTVQSLYNTKETIAEQILEGVMYPWEALPLIGTFIMEIGKTLSEEAYEQAGEDIWIARTAKISKTATVTGPAIIGNYAELRHGSFIRGNVVVGEYAVVGNSTELKNVILFNRVQVPHYNYVGDSILGYGAHLGAGAITSNVKSDKSLVTIRTGEERIETGLKKCGSFIGDRVEVGCGAVLNPGTIIGKCSTIYPLSMVRGYVPKETIHKQDGTVIRKSVK